MGNAGLYELSQYAFLADRNGGEGLTWAKLHDPDCGMITVWAILAAEWFLFMTNAWYLDQVCACTTTQITVQSIDWNQETLQWYRTGVQAPGLVQQWVLNRPVQRSGTQSVSPCCCFNCNCVDSET